MGVFWDLENLRSVTGGTLVARGLAPPDGVSTDTRTIRPGSLYVALRGERFDGHRFVSDAATAGAVGAVVDSTDALPAALPRGFTVLRVPHTGQALLRLGAAYRRSLEGTRVVGVTGSNGKTTTARLIHAVLASTLRGTASAKSFNNAVGVPLTILGARPGDQFLVCEIGSNHPGEVAVLAPVAAPDIVVLTSVGREHLEGFGSRLGAAREAAALIPGMRPGGVVLFNADAPEYEDIVPPLAAQAGATVVRFGEGAAADLRLTDIRAGWDGVTFRINSRNEFAVPLLGRHNAWNGGAAVGVARRFGVGQTEIDRSLRAATGPPMRMEPVQAGGVTFVNDAYNANPESMLGAIASFAELVRERPPRGRAVAVVGDMLELGEHGPGAHREIAAALGASGMFDLAILAGPLSMYAAAELSRAWPGDRVVPVERMDDGAPARIAALLRPGDCVLLKGSRAMRLERVIDAVRNGAPGAAPANSVSLT